MAARSTDTAKKKTAAELLREKKINTCLAQIAQAEEQIRLMTAEKAALTGENIIGLPVTHKQFGSGQVSEQDAITVSVCFESGTRRFPVPQAFLNGFLATGDASMARRLARYRQIGQQIQVQEEEISAANHAIQVLKK